MIMIQLQNANEYYLMCTTPYHPAGEKQGRDKTDGSEDTRLDELTRSLQAATDSIMEDRMTTTQQQQQQQQQQLQQQQQQSFQQSWQEHYQSVSSVHSEHVQQQPPSMPSTSEPARSASPVWDNVYVCCAVA